MLWSAWYDSILTELPGAQAPVVEYALRQAAIDFCDETAIYTATLGAVDVVVGQSAYPLQSPDPEAEAFLVKSVWVNDGEALSFATQDALASWSTRWEALSGDPPKAFTQERYDQVHLVPIPEVGYVGGLVVRAALRPTLTSTGLTDHIATQYFDVLACGAKARLMGMSAKPWTNPDGEAKNRALFEAGKTRAVVDANRSLTRAALVAYARKAV